MLFTLVPMNAKLLVRLLFIVGCVHFCCVASLFAQTTLSGRVTDPDGAAVPSIKVALFKSGHQTATVLSDATGAFQLSNLSAGGYSLHIEAANGFAGYNNTITVSNVPLNIQIQLKLESVAQDVVVAPEPEALSLDESNNRDQIKANANMLEKVPVFDQDYIAALTPFLDQTSVGTGGVVIVVDGVERKGTGVSASAFAEVRASTATHTMLN